MSAETDLGEVAREVKACKLCKLYQQAKQGVPGEGPATAEILFIGEGPGYYEDQQGKPFVGPSGRFLEELLASIDMKRQDVFITNVVKHRPPENRDPEPDEMAACAPYLDRQIAALQPKVIVTLGRYSMARYFPNAKISAIHGQARTINGRLVVAMFHPAAGLRSDDTRRMMVEDFKKLPQLIAKAKQGAAPPPPPPPEDKGPEQLSFF
jgi:uracil-DNA glycosylase family 4